jgi:hypothetical protein
MMQLPGTKVVRPRPLLALVAAATVALALWGSDDAAELDGGPAGQVEAAAVPGTKVPAAGAARHSVAFPARAEAATAEPTLFTVHSWDVPPPPPAPVKAAPPPEPTAPPLPFSFLGSYTPDGGPTVYYLVKGDRILDAHLGDTLDGTYTVDTVQDNQLLLTYTPLQQKQALNLKR